MFQGKGFTVQLQQPQYPTVPRYFPLLATSLYQMSRLRIVISADNFQLNGQGNIAKAAAVGVRSRPPARRCAWPSGCRAIAVTFITDRAGLFLTPEVFGRRATIRALTLKKNGEERGRRGRILFAAAVVCGAPLYPRSPGLGPGLAP